MRLGITILHSAAMHILSFCTRVIPHASGEAILNSGVHWALNLRPACKNETMRMILTFWKFSKSRAMSAFYKSNV